MKIGEARAMFRAKRVLPAPAVPPPKRFGTDRLIDLEPLATRAKPIGSVANRDCLQVILNGMVPWAGLETNLRRAAVDMGWASDVRIVRVPEGPGLLREGDDILIIGHRGAKRSITYEIDGAMYKRRLIFEVPGP